MARTGEARAALIASGAQHLTGVTAFALQDENAAATLSMKLQAPVAGIVPARRDAAPYEAGLGAV